MLTHNRYFEDQVQSIGYVRNGLKATVGVIAPGEYRFTTGAPERMTVVSGVLEADTGAGWQRYAAGTYFEVAGNDAFKVRASAGPAAYLCEFLPAA